MTNEYHQHRVEELERLRITALNWRLRNPQCEPRPITEQELDAISNRERQAKFREKQKSGRMNLNTRPDQP